MDNKQIKLLTEKLNKIDKNYEVQSGNDKVFILYDGTVLFDIEIEEGGKIFVAPVFVTNWYIGVLDIVIGALNAIKEVIGE